MNAKTIDRFAPLGERRDLGKSRRKLIRRAGHGIWRAPSTRPDPVATLLTANHGRQRNLLPIKWARMAASPFGFFRGAAHLMAADLAAIPTSGLQVQLCGDAHVLNLGAFAAPDGHLVFDINDFDETIPGPWEWDIKRMATSLVLAGEEAGASKADCTTAVQAFGKSYRDSLKAFTTMKVLDLVKLEVRRHTRKGPVRAVLQKAERATPDYNLERYTVVNGKNLRQFHDRPPILTHVRQPTALTVIAALASYRQTLGPDHQLCLDSYRPIDVAFKVVGTGSVGTLDYVILLLGNTPNDPLFLQVKEELPSCYSPYLPGIPTFPHQGRRVAEGQHRMQTVTDPFVGWTQFNGTDFLVRQLADHKAGVNIKDLRGEALTEYGLVCGEVLAKAHARTGDPATISGYCGNSAALDKALAQFGFAYAEQTHKDYEAFQQAIKSGRIKVAEES